MGRNPPHMTFKLKAATLLESVLAMALIATVLSFAVGLHAHILSSDKAADRLQAWALTEEILAQRERGAPYGMIKCAGISVVTAETVYAPGMVELMMVCSKDEKIFLERRCILSSVQ